MSFLEFTAIGKCVADISKQNHWCCIKCIFQQTPKYANGQWQILSVHHWTISVNVVFKVGLEILPANYRFYFCRHVLESLCNVFTTKAANSFAINETRKENFSEGIKQGRFFILRAISFKMRQQPLIIQRTNKEIQL